jgi:hypothetical protein
MVNFIQIPLAGECMLAFRGAGSKPPRALRSALILAEPVGTPPVNDTERLVGGLPIGHADMTLI